MPEPGTTEPSPSKPWSGGGREELAAAVRRLMTLTVTSSAPPEVVQAAAHRAEALADELEPFVHAAGPAPVTRFAEETVRSEAVAGLAEAMPFDMIVGRCNPVAPPIEIEFDPPRAIGRTRFATHFEGAPGCVHGAAIAAAFDIMLTAANVLADAAGPTVTLTLRYRKPTVIAEEAVFEAWVTSIDGRRTVSEGRLLQGDVVTVEARGEFVNLDRARIEAMHRRSGAGTPGTDSRGSLES